MTRPRLVVGNWKMNPPTLEAALALARSVAALSRDGVAVGVAPPAIVMRAVAEAVRGSDVGVYGQDVHWEERGAFTGQTSVAMLRGVAAGAIVGHSEVRRDQGDDDERVAKKLVRALGAGLRAILCIGESEAQFEAGATEAVLRSQLTAPLRAAAAMAGGGRSGARFVVAYEPVWAIGTGRPATGRHASAAAAVIRDAMRTHAGADRDAVPVLYGGSVSAASVGEFAAAEGIDGALVGGASLDPAEFGAIIRAFG